MNDIFEVFDFKDNIDEKDASAIVGVLSKEEKKVFDILKSSSYALTATNVYERYIDRIIEEHPALKGKIDRLGDMLHVKNKKTFEIKADFARKGGVKVPTNRTVTRILENLKDAGFLVKREPHNNKAKAYYCLIPKLRIILGEEDPEIKKKKEVEHIITRVKEIKELIKEKK